MSNSWRHIDVETRGDLRCVRLRHNRFEEKQIDDFANELVAAGCAEGCSKIALSLGPKPPDCLYSVFLGKLISVQRRLEEQGRRLLLCDAGPEVQSIFSACKLIDHFTFVADFEAAAQSSTKD
jgi:hypothetical protein